MLQSKDFEGKTQLEEKYYHVPYNRTSIDEEGLTERLRNPQTPDGVMGLPPQNKLLPENFDILPKDETLSQKPVEIEASKFQSSWY